MTPRTDRERFIQNEADEYRRRWLDAETKLWRMRGMKTEDGEPCLPPDDPGPTGDLGVEGGDL